MAAGDPFLYEIARRALLVSLFGTPTIDCGISWVGQVYLTASDEARWRSVRLFKPREFADGLYQPSRNELKKAMRAAHRRVSVLLWGRSR